MLKELWAPVDEVLLFKLEIPAQQRIEVTRPFQCLWSAKKHTPTDAEPDSALTGRAASSHGGCGGSVAELLRKNPIFLEARVRKVAPSFYAYNPRALIQFFAALSSAASARSSRTARKSGGEKREAASTEVVVIAHPRRARAETHRNPPSRSPRIPQR